MIYVWVNNFIKIHFVKTNYLHLLNFLSGLLYKVHPSAVFDGSSRKIILPKELSEKVDVNPCYFT